MGVMGPLEVDGGRTHLGPRDSVVLQALAVRPGTVVRPEAIAEALWGDALPASWPKVVQGCIVRLRKALGQGSIDTSPHGYRLVVHADQIDHLRFERLLGRARELMTLSEPERAAYVLQEALGLWRGPPLENLADWDIGRVEAERLLELRHEAEELLTESLLRAGRHEEALGLALRLVHEAPFRERRWGLLALAQYQSGRQHDALQTVQRARVTLLNELGLDPGPDLVALEQAILRQDSSLAVQAALPESSPDCPFPGLLAFDVADASAFFGRERDIEAGLRRLDEAGILAVVGPSGSGKSSLVRAGIGAALERDGRHVVVITPGRHPLAALSPAGAARGAVLVVDQCEEALSLDEGSPELADFLQALVASASSVPLVLALRADRLGDISVHPQFARLVERGLYLLGAMAPADLRLAIEGPSAQAGLRLEPGLVDLLVREVEGEPGALPLLSHVLRQTWKRREGDVLTVRGYTESGGIRAAVSQSAEALFHDLSPDQQASLRDLMLRLVATDEGGDPVRTRLPRQSVIAGRQGAEVVERMVGARLLSSDGDAVQIAHECLAVAWPRLRSWLDDDVEGLRIMRHVTVAATSWQNMGRPESELYRGARQARAAEWLERKSPTLTESEREFLAVSAALAEKEQRATEEQVRRERRSNQWLRAGLAAVAALLAVALVAGVVARNSAQRATRSALAADARRLGAEALRSTEIDRALLLAVAGARLDPSTDTRNNLTGVLDRVPQLVGAVRSTPLVSIAASPDGSAVATGGALRGVTLFDSTSLAVTARNDDIPVAGVRFSPTGQILAAAVNPWTPSGARRVDLEPLRLLDASTATLLAHQLGGTPRGRVLHHSFAFSPDGRQLAAGFIAPREEPADTVMTVWDVAAPDRPESSFRIPYLVDSVVIRDARHALVTSREGDVHLLDLARQREVRSIHTREAPGSLIGPVAVVLSPDGSTVAVRDGAQVRLLDATDLRTTATFPEEGTIGRPIAFAPDGKHLAYTVDGTAVVRSLQDVSLPGIRYPAGDDLAPWGLAFAGPDTLLAARDDSLLLAWDVSGSRRFVPEHPAGGEGPAGDLAWSRLSPDGRTVANLMSSSDNHVIWLQFLDVRSRVLGPPIPTRHTEGYWHELAWKPDSTAVATMTDDEWIRVWDRTTGLLLEEHREPGDGVTTAAFSGDGSRLAIGTRRGWVRTVDGPGRSSGPPIRVHPSLPVATVALSRDGLRAVATADDAASSLDLTRGTVMRRLALGYTPGAAGWSHNGKSFALSGVDTRLDGAGVVSLVNAQTLKTVSSTSGRITAGGAIMEFSSDGSRFLTVANDLDRVALWETRTGNLLGSLSVDSVVTAGFEPGRPTVVLASAKASVSVWDPRPETAISWACRIVADDLTKAEWQTYLPDREFMSVCPS